MTLPPNGEGLTERDQKTPRLTAHSFRPIEGCAAPREGSCQLFSQIAQDVDAIALGPIEAP